MSQDRDAREGLKERSDTIPCPALLSFYNHDLLQPDDGGNVNLSDLNRALASLGVTEKVAQTLSKGAGKTSPDEDSFNLFTLRDSELDHTSSTGIRDPEVNLSKLEEFLAFGEEQKFYTKQLAEAANHFNKIDPGTKGTLIQSIEFAAVLEMFGELDKEGNRYLDSGSIRSLWIEGKYPANWSPEPDDSLSYPRILKTAAKIVQWRAVFRSSEEIKG